MLPELDELRSRSAAATPVGHLVAVGLIEEARATADSGFQKDELDAFCVCEVAGGDGDNGADLLLACAGKERRRATVELHADHAHALLRCDCCFAPWWQQGS